MSGEIHVDTEALRNHATRVAGLSDKAGQATAAANTVSFSSQMFGSIGSILVSPAMFPLQSAGVTAAGAIENALTETAEAVKATADTFTFIDETVGEHIDEIGRRIR